STTYPPDPHGTSAQQWVARKSRSGGKKQIFPPSYSKKGQPDAKPGQNCTQPYNTKTQHTAAASSLSLSSCSKSISGAPFSPPGSLVIVRLPPSTARGSSFFLRSRAGPCRSLPASDSSDLAREPIAPPVETSGGGDVGGGGGEWRCRFVSIFYSSKRARHSSVERSGMAKDKSKIKSKCHGLLAPLLRPTATLTPTNVPEMNWVARVHERVVFLCVYLFFLNETNSQQG
ncbi:unnamed protein product, partial [Ectocarpus sp. 4 AP-2014]